MLQRGSCTAQGREPVFYNKRKWNLTSNKKTAHLPRLCTAELAGARSWFSSSAPTSFHTRVYSLLQGRQDPGHHITKAGTLQPTVGGASGPFPSPFSRFCCCCSPSSSSCLFPAPLFTDPSFIPNRLTKSNSIPFPQAWCPQHNSGKYIPQTTQAPRPDP